MKEIRHKKEHKKKPGESQRARSRHLKTQHNRDQLKLLNEDKIETATLYVLRSYKESLIRAQLKLITVKKLDRSDYDWQDKLQGYEVVYYSHGNGQQSKLGIAHYVDKYGTASDWYCGDNNNRINTDDILAIIVEEKILKEYPNTNKYPFKGIWYVNG